MFIWSILFILWVYFFIPFGFDRLRVAQPTVYRLRVAQPTLMDAPIFLIYFLYYYICLCTTFLWPLRFGWLLVLSLYKEDYLQIFKCVSFWLHGYCGKWEGWAIVNRFNHTSLVTTVTQADRPKSVRNSCVIKVLVAFLCCHVAFWIVLWVWGFCHGTESDLFLFLFTACFLALSEHHFQTFETSLFGIGILMRMQYPKCAFGLFC